MLPRRRAVRAAGGDRAGRRRGRRGAPESGSGGPRRRPSCRWTPRRGGPPGSPLRAPSPRPRGSGRRRPWPRSPRHRHRAPARRRAPGRPRSPREDGVLSLSCGNRPGGSAAQWRPWCLLRVGAPSAGEAGCGATKKARSTGAGRDHRARDELPGRSRGADGIKKNDRGESGAVHDRIIMHRCVFVNGGGGVNRVRPMPASRPLAGRRALSPRWPLSQSERRAAHPQKFDSNPGRYGMRCHPERQGRPSCPSCLRGESVPKER